MSIKGSFQVTPFEQDGRESVFYRPPAGDAPFQDTMKGSPFQTLPLAARTICHHSGRHQIDRDGVDEADSIAHRPGRPSAPAGHPADLGDPESAGLAAPASPRIACFSDFLTMRDNAEQSKSR